MSTTTTLKKFVARSVKGHYAIRRLRQPITDKEKLAICAQAAGKLNIFYHLGFDHDSKRQFCSKFVHDVYRDALNIAVGKIETFSELLTFNPAASLIFWKVWFFGRVPWARRTVTPASLWHCQKLETVFDSHPDISAIDTTNAV